MTSGLLTSQDIISRCPGLTYRKLDYWCKGGCFGPEHALTGTGGRRRFDEDDVLIARIINRVSLAFQTERGGHADLVTVYEAVARAVRSFDTSIERVTVPLAAGVELRVTVPELAERSA